LLQHGEVGLPVFEPLKVGLDVGFDV
jgi:hypothetical protein